ncbi:hypothetical protein PTI98_000044 [Pleurotus ostreatus]|nr:hypothetical protein PTI98_000044 [Pleurotus ostreatus]
MSTCIDIPQYWDDPPGVAQAPAPLVHSGLNDDGRVCVISHEMKFSVLPANLDRCIKKKCSFSHSPSVERLGQCNLPRMSEANIQPNRLYSTTRTHALSILLIYFPWNITHYKILVVPLYWSTTLLRPFG